MEIILQKLVAKTHKIKFSEIIAALKVLTKSLNLLIVKKIDCPCLEQQKAKM